MRGLQRCFRTLHLVWGADGGGNRELAELFVEDVWMIVLKACWHDNNLQVVQQEAGDVLQTVRHPS